MLWTVIQLMTDFSSKLPIDCGKSIWIFNGIYKSCCIWHNLQTNINNLQETILFYYKVYKKRYIMARDLHHYVLHSLGSIINTNILFRSFLSLWCLVLGFNCYCFGVFLIVVVLGFFCRLVGCFFVPVLVFCFWVVIFVMCFFDLVLFLVCFCLALELFCLGFVLFFLQNLDDRSTKVVLLRKIKEGFLYISFQ